MPRKPNYAFERNERNRAKAEKKAARSEAKAARRSEQEPEENLDEISSTQSETGPTGAG